ncbi:hypothetical protein ABIA03_006676 [Bradyrhizobium yuanmingense]|uniref:Uncharacterized protein n=1 Tax=Bradyrhizobium yuanmingense TaxID=108015 RepID=A0ABV4GVY4_9BRAD
MNIFHVGAGTWSTTARYEQRWTPLGACTLPGIAASMQRMAVVACSNVICKGGGKRARVTVMPRNSQHSGLPISSGFPMTNVEAHRGRYLSAG